MKNFLKTSFKGLALATAIGACTSAFALQAPTFNKTASAAPANKAEFTMNIGHVAGSEHPVNIALKQFKENVEKRSDGKLAVNVYDSGSLGGELEMMEQMNLVH